MKIAPYQIENYINSIATQKIAGCLVFGPEASLVNYRFNLIASKIAPDLSDPFLVSNLSKERISEDKGLIADEFFAMSMLGGRKLILVKDGDAKVSEGLKILTSDGDFAKKSENFILIQAGNLEKSSALRKICEASPAIASIACYEDNEATIKKFIYSELVKRKIKFLAPVTLMILEKFGHNRTLILSEIEKIVSFLGDKSELTVEMVERLSNCESESSINNFVNNFSAQKFDLALLDAEKNFRNKIEPIMMIRFLSNYLQKLYRAKSDIESGNSNFEEAIKNQRLFFKVENEFRKHLTQNSLEFLIRNLRILEGLELKIKSGHKSPRLLFTSFIQGEMINK